MAIDNRKPWPDLAGAGAASPSGPGADEVLRLDDLHVSVHNGAATAVRGVSLRVRPGEIVGLVGESGSGKTLTCRAALGVLPAGCAVERGSVSFAGVDVTSLSRRGWETPARQPHGRGVPGPGVLPEPVDHRGRPARRGAAGEAAPEPPRGAPPRASSSSKRWACASPSGSSTRSRPSCPGGMLQRVMIAIAISCDPQLLVADEPTTALDVTIQAEVLELLRQLRDERGLAVLFVSHDLAVITRAVRPHRGVLRRGDRGVRARRGDHPATAASLHPGAAAGGLGRRLRPARAGGHRRTAAAGGRGHHRVPLRGALPGRRPGMPGRPGPFRCRSATSIRCAACTPPAQSSASGHRPGDPGCAGPGCRTRAAADGRVGRRDPRPRLAGEPGPVRRRPRHLARRDRRPGRRDRLGEDDAGAHRGRAGEPRTGPGRPRRPAHLRPAPGRPAGRAAPRARAAGVPGPAPLARPGPDRRRNRGRGAQDPRRGRPRGDPAAGDRRPGPGRPGRHGAGAHAGPDLRRPAPARVDRPGAGRRAPAADLRRAGERPGREQPEPRPAPARASCGTRSGCRSSSSPTTSARWRASPTASWCSTGAGSSRTDRSTRCSPRRGTRIRPCSWPPRRASGTTGRSPRTSCAGPGPARRRRTARRPACSRPAARSRPTSARPSHRWPTVGERWRAACHRHQEWEGLAQPVTHTGRTDPCPSSSSA